MSEADDYKDWVIKVSKRQYMDEIDLKKLCNKLKDVFLNEENVLELTAPINIIGDIHGQFLDLLNIFKMVNEDFVCRGQGSITQQYLFLGDFVDRGHYSIETIQFLLLLKLLYRDKIYLIRGNHESRASSSMYGFHEECRRKYGNNSVWKMICDIFDYFPLASRVSLGKRSIFCVHGGLSPSILHINEINEINRFREIPMFGAMSDLLWSDPEPQFDDEGMLFRKSSRGCGYLFGKTATDIFCNMNSVELVIRSHQLAREGYQYFFPNRNCLIVWSAPNYCYREGNLASFMSINEDFNKEIHQFDNSMEPEDINSFLLGQ